MAGKYLILRQWEAIELFCKLVEKAENEIRTSEGKARKIYDWSDFDDIQSTLKKYARNRPENRKAAAAIFSGDQVSSLETMADAILKNNPYVIKSKLRLHLNRIFPNGLPVRGKELNDFEFHNKIEELQGTSWWLYHYDDYTIEDERGNSRRVSGIVRGVLRFREFGKVHLEAVDPSNNNSVVTYDGYLELYGKGDFMMLRCKTSKTKGKNLHVMLSLSEHDSFDLAIGIYHNIHQSHYAGTILIERLRTSIPGKKVASFFSKSDEEYSTLPSYVREYLDQRGLNFIKAPVNISTQQGIEKWLRDKRNKKP
jgi:hypothetical protein